MKFLPSITIFWILNIIIHYIQKLKINKHVLSFSRSLTLSSPTHFSNSRRNARRTFFSCTRNKCENQANLLLRKFSVRSHFDFGDKIGQPSKKDWKKKFEKFCKQGKATIEILRMHISFEVCYFALLQGDRNPIRALPPL